MAFKLIWSPAARDDLHDIVVFIAHDNPNRAMSFGYQLISETDRLQEFPELGRSVPEWLCLKSRNLTWTGSVQGAVATWSNYGIQESLGNIAC